MKANIPLGLVLFALTAALSLPATAKSFDQNDLRRCVERYDLALKRRGNVERLGEVLDDIHEQISSYDDRLDEIDQALSHTIGYRRSELIYQYNNLVEERNRYAGLSRKAAAKRKKRIKQMRAHAEYVDQQCSDFSISDEDWDAVCAGEGGFCSEFD